MCIMHNIKLTRNLKNVIIIFAILCNTIYLYVKIIKTVLIGLFLIIVLLSFKWPHLFIDLFIRYLTLLQIFVINKQI